MPNIIFNKNKTLKLTNVLFKQVDIITSEELQDINAQIRKMQNYIRVRGVQQIGPLIQYNKTIVNESDKLEVKTYLMLQCSSFIHNVENPYKMESIIRVSNCMYCHYVGAEDKIKFAYDKINLFAFENDIPLKGDNYTIFINKDELDETITADVFMERAD